MNHSMQASPEEILMRFTRSGEVERLNDEQIRDMYDYLVGRYAVVGSIVLSLDPYALARSGGMPVGVQDTDTIDINNPGMRKMRAGEIAAIAMNIPDQEILVGPYIVRDGGVLRYARAGVMIYVKNDE